MDAGLICVAIPMLEFTEEARQSNRHTPSVALSTTRSTCVRESDAPLRPKCQVLRLG